MYGRLASSLSGIEPPLWCALTAAFVRERGYSVRIIDGEAENLSPPETVDRIAEYNPRLAVIVVLGTNPSASSTPKMTAAGEVAAALAQRAPHIKRLMTGLHPSALPVRTIREENIDFVAQGEGLYTILHLLAALRAGNRVPNADIPGLWYRQDGQVVANPPAPLVNLEELPMAAWDLLPMDRYRAHNWQCFGCMEKRQCYGVIYTSLGCPFNCSYCNIHVLYNDKPGIRFRSPEKVVMEIDLLVKNYKIKSLKVIDELFALREDRVIQICDLIIQHGHDLNIWCYARVDTITERMLRKMKRAGINWICYGFESASELVRQGVAKKTSENITRRAIEMTKAAGINILANFMFGLPDDNLETMQATLDMAKEDNFEYVNFYTVMAYPGSQLYRDAMKQGISLPEHWHGYGQYSEETLPLPTKYLSAAEVLDFRDQAFREYLSNPAYLEMIGRKFGPPSVEHIKGILKQEIHRKFGKHALEQAKELSQINHSLSRKSPESLPDRVTR
jgi:radical SAM superfamily enzyme YgiQ (UPF0313 family)